MYKSHLIHLYIETESGKTKATENDNGGQSILPECSFWNDHEVAELSIVPFPTLQLESYRKGKVPGWK